VLTKSRSAIGFFSGSLAIQAILVAVATIVAAAYEKISNLPEVEPTYRKFLWSIAALSAVACLVSFMSFGRLAGVQIPRMLVIGSLLLLIAGTAVVSVGIVVITLIFLGMKRSNVSFVKRRAPSAPKSEHTSA
jgi:hypothetical protein